MNNTLINDYEEVSSILQIDRDRDYKRTSKIKIESPVKFKIDFIDIPSIKLTDTEDKYRIHGIEAYCGKVHPTNHHRELYELLLKHFTSNSYIYLSAKHNVTNVKFEKIDSETVKKMTDELKQYL